MRHPHRRRRLAAAVAALATVGAVAVGLAVSQHHQAVPASADPCHVSGRTFCVLNRAVTQATLRRTICVVGWTSTVRPPASYTTSLKKQQLAAERLADQNPAHYEEDHRLPLELGGDPRDPMNLSPEAHPGSLTKDAAENQAKVSVCSGGADLRATQRAFVLRWLLTWPRYAANP